MNIMPPQAPQRDLNKEAFLWYTLTSPEYMDRAVKWLEMADAFLKEQVKIHPIAKDFGPSVYWGGVIERLLETYPNARVMLAHGEFGTMRDWCIKAGDIGRGFMEQGTWMGKDEFRSFLDLIDRAYKVCGAFMGAITMTWHFASPSIISGFSNWKEYDQDDGYKGDSILCYLDNLPEQPEIPAYRVDHEVTIKTGQIVPWTGVWVPVGGMGAAALVFARQGQVMQPMYPITHVDEDEYEYTEPVETEWHPVKPTGRTISLRGPQQTRQLRILASQPCPRGGYWFTPAKPNSRRYFKQGDSFPEIEGNSYGATFWQWSPDQSDPSLR